jgi:hypothetical protein
MKDGSKKSFVHIIRPAQTQLTSAIDVDDHGNWLFLSIYSYFADPDHDVGPTTYIRFNTGAHASYTLVNHNQLLNHDKTTKFFCQHNLK